MDPNFSNRRENRLIALLAASAVTFGSVLQVFVEPGPLALVVWAGIAGTALVVLALTLRGRFRSTLSSFRFVSVILVALAFATILGTLVIQGKAPGLYSPRYDLAIGGIRLPIGDIIVALRLHDVFHSLWFGGLLALLSAAVAVSAARRWPIRIHNVGFYFCHLGIIAVLAGAAVSAIFSARGRLDLHAGGDSVRSVNAVQHGLFDSQGRSVTSSVPLGFDLRLDRFEVVRYGSRHRIAYYERDGDEPPRLRASFDPVPGAGHRLPGGSVFRVGALSKDATGPAAILSINTNGRHFETPPLHAESGDYVDLPDGRGIVTFERAPDEVKSFRSDVTVTRGNTQRTAVVAVNDPFSFGGWTFYQSSHDAADPTYSGLEAVHDPGVPLVFLGFAAISLGVIVMFYVGPRLKGRGSVS